ncbi:Histone deacetylase 8 [Eumeta japonica]|uniref:histone deacetylase n=1 Tax=Eumeta variegata TaxID=151549 RepID=A0A4C1XPR3_EUMVA|nr:Histone deacetylase 8 [Eumeta japonica]
MDDDGGECDIASRPGVESRRHAHGDAVSVTCARTCYEIWRNIRDCRTIFDRHARVPDYRKLSRFFRQIVQIFPLVPLLAFVLVDGWSQTVTHTRYDSMSVSNCRFAAEGFCYINDVVIAIEKLRRQFPKVLYIDLDAHHGNGVEDAYNLSRTVLTLSFHKYEAGYYPGSGAVGDIGSMVGKGFACNFPFKPGYTDQTLAYAFDSVFPVLSHEFAPDAFVVQCGADALARDPHGGGALTAAGYVHCVRAVLDRRKPTLLLGGVYAYKLLPMLPLLAARVPSRGGRPAVRTPRVDGDDITLAFV